MITQRTLPTENETVNEVLYDSTFLFPENNTSLFSNFMTYLFSGYKCYSIKLKNIDN